MAYTNGALCWNGFSLAWPVGDNTKDWEVGGECCVLNVCGTVAVLTPEVVQPPDNILPASSLAVVGCVPHSF